MPLVSIVMPVYNSSEYLNDAVKSILSQSFSDFELIIIDNLSTDSSLDIVDEFKANDDRIVVIRNKENKGLIYSLNLGLRISKGKYIARMDADDKSLDSRLGKQLQLMESDNLDICGCHYMVIDEKDKVFDVVINPLSSKYLLLWLCGDVPFAHGSVMLRKQFIIDHDLQYERDQYDLIEDMSLWLKFYQHDAKFSNVDEVLYVYRRYGSSLSSLNKNYGLKQKKKLLGLFLLENYDDYIGETEMLIADNPKLYFGESVVYFSSMLRLSFSFFHIRLVSKFFFQQSNMAKLVLFYKFIFRKF